MTYTFGSLTVNHASADCLHTDFEEGQILGLDGAPVRRQIDPVGQASGGLYFPALYAHRIITFQGKVLIQSAASEDRQAYVAAVNVVEAAARAALEAQLNSAGTLAWTPTGGSAHSISCYYGVPGGEFQTTGNMIDRSFTFQLFAPNPTIS